MKKSDVKIGEIYLVKVSGKLVRVKLDCECPYGGWFGTSLSTKKQIRIRTAARLRADMTSSEKRSHAVTMLAARTEALARGRDVLGPPAPRGSWTCPACSTINEGETCGGCGHALHQKARDPRAEHFYCQAHRSEQPSVDIAAMERVEAALMREED